MKIKLLGMDVDGTMTDGRIYVGPDGETMKSFYAKDGYGIREFIKKGGIPVILTGRRSKIVETRCRELGICEIFQGVDNKLRCLVEVANRHNIEKTEIAYIGDDLNDLDCLNFAGISACPADAVPDIKVRVNYVCTSGGGQGAVREFIDWLLKD